MIYTCFTGNRFPESKFEYRTELVPERSFSIERTLPCLNQYLKNGTFSSKRLVVSLLSSCLQPFSPSRRFTLSH